MTTDVGHIKHLTIMLLLMASPLNCFVVLNSKMDISATYLQEITSQR